MSWTELVGVQIEYFKAGDAFEGEREIPTGQDGPVFPEEPDGILKATGSIDDCQAWLPDNPEDLIGEDGKLTQDLVGFNFAFMGQSVGLVSYDGLIENDFANSSAVDVFEDSLQELADIGRKILAEVTNKPSLWTEQVSFVSVWTCNVWGGYEGEYDSSYDLIGYLALRETKNVATDLTIPVRTLRSTAPLPKISEDFL